ncbi:hypothetical protein ASG19_19905 [Rhizobium sp. Leaf306]|nr:hypothetical protein ASG19_19905 [Rhizobium sp. Leaf306]
MPVLVPGIQQRRVCGAEGSFHANDFVCLDPCDRHRDEEERKRFPSSPKIYRQLILVRDGL